MRIMAEVDKEFVGQTILSPGYTVCLHQPKPNLDDRETVRNIVEGVSKTSDK